VITESATSMNYKKPILWAFVAFILRLIVGLAIHIYSVNAGYKGFVPLASYNDDVLYWEVSNALYSGNTPEFVPNIYPVFLAYFFQLTSPSILGAKFLNILSNVFSVFFGVLLVRDICSTLSLSKRQAKLAMNVSGLLFSIYPSQLFYSTQMIKDPFLIFFGMVNIYVSLCILRSRLTFFLCLAWLATFLGLLSFRPYAALSLLISIISYLLFVWKTKTTRKIIVIIMIVGLSAFLPSILGLGFFASDYIGPFLNPEKIAEFREVGYSIGDSSTDIVIDYSSPVSFLLTFGLSSLTTMFGPFPWQIKSAVQLIAFPEAAFALLIVMTVSLSKLKRRKPQPKPGGLQKNSNEIILINLFCFTLICMISLFSDNLGANTRLRVLPWNLFIISASISFAQSFCNRQPKMKIAKNSMV
jgi:hypothetical protein